MSPAAQPPLSRNSNFTETRARPGLLVLLAMGAVIASVAWLAHGWWFNSASVLDDHWHQRNLRVHGWSFDELIATTRIEPAAWQHLWWQNQTMLWEYARPVFTLVMKALYLGIGHEDPWWLHAASFVMHVWVACLVARLAWLLTRRAFWSLFAAVLFLLYPHAVVSVAWPSALNCVLHTLLMVGALLVYLRASGLDVFAASGAGGAVRSSRDFAAGKPEDARRGPNTPHVLGRGRLAVVLVLWVLALFTRENSLLLPVMFVAADLAFGGWRHVRRRLGVYAVFAVLAVLFVVWRTLRFTHPPPEVYVRLPAGEGLEYPLWLAAKLLHYVCTAVWFAPMSIGPTGRFHPWVEVPGDVALMLGIVAVWAVCYFFQARRLRGWWLWPLWIVLMVLPVAPVIATPHTGYACGVGLALALAAPAGLRRRGGHFLAGEGTRTSGVPLVRATPSANSRATSPLVGAVLAGGAAWIYLLLSVVTTVTNHWQWNAIAAAEKWGNDSVLVSPPPAGVTDVFAINLPFVNVYSAAALARAMPERFEGVRWHTLVYAPQIAVLEDAVYVTALDGHRLEVRSGGQPFFSRLLGRFLFEAFREGPRFATGDHFENAYFQVDIADADVHGVRRLVFTFPKRLDDPSYCFYVSSVDCGAFRMRFGAARPFGWETELELEGAADSERRRRTGQCPSLKAGAPIKSLDTHTLLDVDAATERVWTDARPEAVDVLFSAVADEDRGVRETAEASLNVLLGCVSRAMAAAEQDLVAKYEKSRADWEALRAWWHLQVDAEILGEMRALHEELSYLLKIREELPHAIWWASKAIRSDLYLTGPAFPTSREELRVQSNQVTK